MEDCPGSGDWNPVLELRHRKGGSVTKGTLINLAICDEHKAGSTLATFLSAEAFTKIIKYMRECGKVAPIQRNTTLSWSRVDQPELRSVDTMPDPSKHEELAF